MLIALGILLLVVVLVLVVVAGCLILGVGYDRGRIDGYADGYAEGYAAAERERAADIAPVLLRMQRCVEAEGELASATERLAEKVRQLA